MPDLPVPIERYISACNALDVEGILACVTEDVSFRNYSGAEVNAEAEGKPCFAEMARFGASIYVMRCQTVVRAITVADTTAVEYDLQAVIAHDLPNGWTRGQELAYRGTASFRLRDGLIAGIVNQI